MGFVGTLHFSLSANYDFTKEYHLYKGTNKTRPESFRLFCKPGLDGFAPVELRCTDELIGGENRGSSGTVNGALAASSGLGIGVS